MRKRSKANAERAGLKKPGCVAIIGLGLMGGSLGLACRRNRVARVVHGYARRAATRRLAVRIGAVDRVFNSPQAAVRDADIVVFCLPVLSIPAIARQCAPHMRRNALVTDVGSTKQQLASQLASMPISFIGSHPIAGSEKSGIENARANLYKGRAVVVTPAGAASRTDVKRLLAFWRAVGAQPVVMTPARHDQIIARTSHLPHLAAAALVAVALRDNVRVAPMLCGTGFQDATRIAMGSPDMWHDIMATNRRAVLKELDRFSSIIAGFRKSMAAKDLESVRKFLQECRAKRCKLTRK